VIEIPKEGISRVQESFTSGRPSKVTVVFAIGIGQVRFRKPVVGHSSAMA